MLYFIPLTILVTWLYNRSRRSILSTTIFHAAFNTFPFVLPYSPPLLGLIFVWAACAVVSDRMWRRTEETGQQQGAVVSAFSRVEV